MQQIPDMSELLKLAQSPVGQQLLAMLQQSGGSNLQNAIGMAAAGDYTQAKKVLTSLLSSPEAQALLKQMEDSE